MIEPSYPHRMAAHCESGTLTGLFNHAGLAISEPMLFGIAGGIFFGYLRPRGLPFPTFVVRSRPGSLRKHAVARLGLRCETRTFRREDDGMRALDRLLDRGVPVGAQVDFFHMEYLPEYERVHFNAHFVTLVGRSNGHYLVSDVYHPRIARLPFESLRRARFAKGEFAARGRLFRPLAVPPTVPWESAIRAGIRSAAFAMTRLPFPFLGVRGIRLFARKVQEWPRLARDEDHLSHEVMSIHVILEDRGTGGAGFRFMYASFLQEASRVLSDPDLAEAARGMMENGDRWREISLFVARIGQRRDLGPARLRELGDMILERADDEERLFGRLLRKFPRQGIFSRFGVRL